MIFRISFCIRDSYWSKDCCTYLSTNHMHCYTAQYTIKSIAQWSKCYANSKVAGFVLFFTTLMARLAILGGAKLTNNIASVLRGRQIFGAKKNTWKCVQFILIVSRLGIVVTLSSRQFWNEDNNCCNKMMETIKTIKIIETGWLFKKMKMGVIGNEW